MSFFERGKQDEIELKLSFQPEDLPRLRNLPIFRSLSSGRPRTRTLISVYYDSPDLALRKKLVALRVRKTAGRYVQGVKTGAAHIGGIIVRKELESPVPTKDPVLAAIEDESLRRIISRAGKLEPIFRTEFKRTSRQLTLEGGCEVTLDIDIGEIVAAAAREPICEMELELKSGPPHRLFDLAMAVLPSVPLRLSTISKAKRGYALLSGEKPGWRKDVPIDLSADATVEEALAHTVQHCLDHMLDNEACVLESEDPEGIHQMRVALRRLRSALTLYRHVLPAEQYGTVVGEVKWLTGQLAPIRDWDVFGMEILEPVAAQFPGDKAFRILLNGLGKETTRQRRLARKAIRSERYSKFLLRIGQWLAQRSWRDQPLTETSVTLLAPVGELASARLAKRHKKIRKRGRGIAEMSPAERHQLRIDVKRLRYAINFFTSLFPPKKAKRFSEKLSDIQDYLGYLNDIAVAKSLLQRLCDLCQDSDAPQCRRAAGIVIGWHTHAMTQSESKLVADMSSFMKLKPFWSKRG